MLNEWLFHDLNLENGDANFRDTSEFLLGLQNSNIKLVVPAKKRWLEKAFKLIADGMPRVRSVGRMFHDILRDSDRAIWTNSEDMQAVSEDLYVEIPEEDIYLVKAYHCASADLLVTTDTELFRMCESNKTVNCQMRDEFLKSFQENNLA